MKRKARKLTEEQRARRRGFFRLVKWAKGLGIPTCVDVLERFDADFRARLPPRYR